MFAFQDFFETSDGIFKRHVFSFAAGELRGDEERLRQEALNFSCAGYRLPVDIRELFDAKNCDNVLQLFVALERSLHFTSNVVVLAADEFRIKCRRARGKWIYCRINSDFSQC